MPISKTHQDENTEQYSYNYDALWKVSPDLRYPDQEVATPDFKYPMAARVFTADNSLTKWPWTRDIVSVALRIIANQAMQDISVRKGSACRLITFIRLSRILENTGTDSGLESLFNTLVSVVRIFSNIGRRISGKSPKSQAIQQDVKAEHPEMVEARLESMAKDIQNQAERRDGGEHPSLADYRDLFQIIYLPDISYHFLEDRAFAAQRVAGANPLVINRISALPDHFPVTEQQFQAVMGEGESFQTALNDGRVYLADYQILKEIVPGTVDTKVKGKPETLQKYSFAPLALFAIAPGNCPGRLLTPIAIQCNQDAGSPIFTPPSLEASEGERLAWRMAKTVVQIADGNYHELISHLGRTHLWIEPIALGTYRRLGTEHPLGKLLLPHFEGTFFINNAAAKSLISPDGIVDKLLFGTIQSSVQLSVKGAKGYPFSFNDSMLPQTFAARGVDDRQKLPDYPYRDDALLIWHAIHDWVEAYLQLFYKDDHAVRNDGKLQAWLQELRADNGGQMTDIGEVTPEDSEPKIRTLDYLIDATTLIIFTCSAQHAAVNFPQASMMAFVPNMPLAGFREAPDAETASEADYFSLLPPLGLAEQQLDTVYTLGSVYYTQLGHYKANQVDLDEIDQHPYFTDPQIAHPLKAFQNKLQEIELIIQDRNETRPTYYDTLLPSQIPQSTNI